MGDDNKIEALEVSAKAREAFLRDISIGQAGKPQLYDLDEEFAKTRRNRSWFSVVLVLGFTAVVAAATAAITLYIEERNRRITIDIKDFEDVNLKDLLSTVKKNENDLQLVKQEIDQLGAERDAKVQSVTEQVSGKIAVINAQDISASDKEQQIGALTQDQKRQVALITADYQKRIAAKQADAAEIQKRIDEYDSRQLELMRKQEEVLNNQQRLHDMELKRTTDLYEARLQESESRRIRETEELKRNQQQVLSTLNETHRREIAALVLKYNPVLDTEPIRGVLAATVGDSPASVYPALKDRLQKGALVSQELLTRLEDGVAKRDLLLTRVLQIPYENSIPRALRLIAYFDKLALRAYQDMGSGLVDAIDQRNQRIQELGEQLNTAESIARERDRMLQVDASAYQFLARSLRVNGLVIDPSQEQSMAIFIDPVYTPSDGDLGFVFRKDDEYIATIRFQAAPTGTRAAVVELAEGKQIQPFDRILLKKS